MLFSFTPFILFFGFLQSSVFSFFLFSFTFPLTTVWVLFHWGSHISIFSLSLSFCLSVLVAGVYLRGDED